MTPNDPLAPATASPDAKPAPSPRYEPPRILSKRSVERVTLLSGTIGPGGPPIGGE